MGLRTNYQNMFQNRPTNDNPDYLSYIQQYGSSALTQVSGGKDWGASWFLEALQNGDTNAKVQAGTNLVINLFTDLSTNDVSKANKTNNQDSASIDGTKTKTKELFSSVDKSLQTIMSACEGNAEKINSALEEIEKLGGKDSDVVKKQQELKTKLNEIKTQQEKLNNPNTTSEERREAIKIILGAAGEIKVMADDVIAIKKDLEDQQKIVEESSKEVTDLSQQMEEIVEKGTDDVQNLTQENMQQMAQDTNKVAESVQKKALGTEQVTTGTAMETGPQAIVTGQKGAELIASGTSKIAGGVELMSGAIKDFKGIADITNNLSEGYNNFQNYAQGIGEYCQGISDLVGAFGENIDPMIKSIGSWQTVADTNNALGKYTVQYAQAIGMSEVEADSDGNVIVDSNETPIYNEEKKQDNLKNDVQYNFDMSSFDNAFKVKEV